MGWVRQKQSVRTHYYFLLTTFFFSPLGSSLAARVIEKLLKMHRWMHAYKWIWFCRNSTGRGRTVEPASQAWQHIFPSSPPQPHAGLLSSLQNWTFSYCWLVPGFCWTFSYCWPIVPGFCWGALWSSCSPRAKAGLSSGHGSCLAAGRGPGVSGKTLVILLTRKILSNHQELSWSYESLFHCFVEFFSHFFGLLSLGFDTTLWK